MISEIEKDLQNEIILGKKRISWWYIIIRLTRKIFGSEIEFKANHLLSWLNKEISDFINIWEYRRKHKIIMVNKAP